MKRFQWSVIALASVLLADSASAAFLVSEKEVLRQARVEWLSMKRHVPLESRAGVQNYVECVANNVLAALPKEATDNIDWEVVVFDEDEINAFADPNGKIGVFNGILRVADTPDALAAVIGHEIAHATQGHVMVRARKNARQEIWATIGGAATGAGDMWRQGLAIMSGLPFAREQETEADLVGLDYMANAGFDPRAAVYLWKNMAAAKLAQGREQVPEFLSTHPSDSARIDNMIKSLTPALIKFNAAREAGHRPACTTAG
ncbi:MAG TPA: M48 family metallopeptidase [Gammaproteobacteria bacterium]|nr:M48 family metallopeptidase [Gammaproteobacteria bacterium]